MKKFKVTLVLSMLLLFSFGLLTNVEKSSASSTPASVYDSVAKAYGDKYPLSSSNLITTSRTNVFGGYSSVLGVSAKFFTDYKAAKKSNSKLEYVSFICKTSSAANAKKVIRGLRKYVKNEKAGNENYFSAKGKKLMTNAKIGSKGNMVYLFILDTAKNKKAVSAFRKNV